MNFDMQILLFFQSLVIHGYCENSDDLPIRLKQWINYAYFFSSFLFFGPTHTKYKMWSTNMENGVEHVGTIYGVRNTTSHLDK